MPEKVIVSTGDINQAYDIIGPVYFQINNRPEGFGESTFSEYKKLYLKEIDELKSRRKAGETVSRSTEWKCVYGEYCLGEGNFEIAFFIAVEELKKRAAMLGADGVVFMRQDIDLDREAYQFFYLQMYGTAVKIK
jgi:hypothetical protein